jgi:hypothetical protein
MGKWLYQHFILHGIKPVIIDPKAGDIEGAVKVIKRHADSEALVEAGLQQAVGVVAGTDNDHVNLSLLMSIQSLKPDAFTIVRQNRHENQVAFDATNASLVLQSSLTTARRVLKHLISPQIQVFVDYLRDQGEDICEQAVQRLQSMISEQPPHLWHCTICDAETAAVTERLRDGKSLNLGQLRRDPHQLDGTISCMPLTIRRDGEYIMLPADGDDVRLGDDILFCGTEHGETMLSATMNNPYTLDYLIYGHEQPRGYFFRWLESRGREVTKRA